MPDQQIRESLAPAMTRRAFLATMGTAAGSVVLGTPLTSLRALAGQPAGADFKLSALESNAKYGGTLRYGVLSAPAHFDVHQSGTISNMAPQGPMYDNLIRRDPRDGQTIIPDLAYHWEIAPDTKTYTFFLRQGVQFHDGAEFTAEDVKATYARIIWPPQNYAKWHNEAFQRLLPQLDREADERKRQALVRQAEDLLEQDPALLPLAWLKCNDAWYPYVKGPNPANFFGTYDVVRWDTAWLDK